LLAAFAFALAIQGSLSCDPDPLFFPLPMPGTLALSGHLDSLSLKFRTLNLSPLTFGFHLLC
jgi:hypothetical protein